nr:hypothetical protein [Tanacetum cinerariifolium]
MNEDMHPMLKGVALASPRGSKAMTQVAGPDSEDMVFNYIHEIIGFHIFEWGQLCCVVCKATVIGRLVLTHAYLSLIVGEGYTLLTTRRNHIGLKATKMNEDMHPMLKGVALASPRGSKAMTQVSQQILTVTL